MSDEYTGGTYQIELLKASNWMPWNWQIMAIFGLENHTEKGAVPPGSADPQHPTTAEQKEQKKWAEGDVKVRVRIELAISDAKMVHIMGAENANQMWEQLTMVKKSHGQLGMLATHQALF